MHNLHIGGMYRQNRQQHGHHPSLRMSVNRVSTSFHFASWVIFYLIGCRHPFMRYWQPLLAKTTATCSRPHPENERQRSVNRFRSCIFGNQDIAWIFAVITQLLTAILGKILYIEGKIRISNLSILQAAKHAQTYYWLLKT